MCRTVTKHTVYYCMHGSTGAHVSRASHSLHGVRGARLRHGTENMIRYVVFFYVTVRNQYANSGP